MPPRAGVLVAARGQRQGTLAREASTLGTEKFTFEECARDGGAIHFDEGSVGAGRASMQGAGNGGFARAVFASDQHGHVHGGSDQHGLEQSR